MSNKHDNEKAAKEKEQSEPGNDMDQEIADITGLDNVSRRLFIKRAGIGGGVALAGGAVSHSAARVSLEGRPIDDYPLTDETLFKPKDQRDVVLNFVSSKALNKKYPERNEQYNRLQEKEFDWVNGIADMYSIPWDNSKPGYTQKDRALQKAGWEPLNIAGSRGSANLQPDTPFNSWDHSQRWKTSNTSSRVNKRQVMP